MFSHHHPFLSHYYCDAQAESGKKGCEECEAEVACASLEKENLAADIHLKARESI